MFALGTPAPVTEELIPAHGDRPAVTVTFNPQPTPLSLRAARRAVAAVLRDGQPNATERAGDAFSAALIRFNIVAWSGIGTGPDKPVEPTHDRELLDGEGKATGVEPGTISAFLAEPRLVEAADRKYVLPWTRLDAEKNGYAPSPSGTSAGATRADDIASSPAKPPKARAAKSARTSGGSRGRTRAKGSGSSSSD